MLLRAKVGDVKSQRLACLCWQRWVEDLPQVQWHPKGSLICRFKKLSCIFLSLRDKTQSRR